MIYLLIYPDWGPTRNSATLTRHQASLPNAVAMETMGPAEGAVGAKLPIMLNVIRGNNLVCFLFFFARTRPMKLYSSSPSFKSGLNFTVSEAAAQRQLREPRKNQEGGRAPVACVTCGFHLSRLKDYATKDEMRSFLKPIVALIRFVGHGLRILAIFHGQKRARNVDISSLRSISYHLAIISMLNVLII